MVVQQRRSGTAARAVGFSALGVAAVAAAAAIAAATVAVVFARTVVTPAKKREEDIRILAVDGDRITLSATKDSVIPGRYSLWFRQDEGHARIGEILSSTRETVTRELLDVVSGDLEGAVRARIGGWFYSSPADLGYPFDEVALDTQLGPAPAWLVPADPDPANPDMGRWMIGVHGRGVRRQETLRAVPTFRDHGYTSLLISYRNDGDAPDTADHRYSLGDTEWNDVEVAIRYALDLGARSIVLMGWSMGGATVLQAATRSSLAGSITGLVLESPVVDWITALHYQGIAYRLPRPVRAGVLALLGTRWAGRLTGQSTPIDLGRLDLVAHADELHVPILLLHSDDDGYIPSTASRALAEARPDIVTFEAFDTARHTRLWNYDPERWTAAIARWLKVI